MIVTNKQARIALPAIRNTNVVLFDAMSLTVTSRLSSRLPRGDRVGVSSTITTSKVGIAVCCTSRVGLVVVEPVGTVGGLVDEAAGVCGDLSEGDTVATRLGPIVAVEAGKLADGVADEDSVGATVGPGLSPGRDGAGVANGVAEGGMVGASSFGTPFWVLLGPSRCKRRRPFEWRRSFTLGRSG